MQRSPISIFIKSFCGNARHFLRFRWHNVESIDESEILSRSEIGNRIKNHRKFLVLFSIFFNNCLFLFVKIGSQNVPENCHNVDIS